MKKHLSSSIISLIIFLWFSNSALASEPSYSNESEIANQLSQQNSFKTDVPDHDPFKPIITKKEPKKIIVERHETTKIAAEKPKLLIEPLKIQLTGICGNDNLRQAIINHKNEEFTVKPGQTINGIFKVIDISANKLVVYSIKEEKRHSFSMTSAD